MSNYQNLCANQHSTRRFTQAVRQICNEALFKSPVSLIKIWNARSNQRAQLARLTPEQLEDIGISSMQLQTELNKPFWMA